MIKETNFFSKAAALYRRFVTFLSAARYHLIYLLLPAHAKKQLDGMVHLKQSHFITLSIRLNGQDFAYDTSWVKYLQKRWTRHGGNSKVSTWPLFGDYSIYYEGHKPEIPYKAYATWHLAQKAADEKNEDAQFHHEEPLWKVYKFR